MTANLLLLPGVLVAGFAVLFLTTVLERLVGPSGPHQQDIASRIKRDAEPGRKLPWASP